MTTQANTITTATFNGVPPSNFTVDIAPSATSITMGNATTLTTFNRLNEVRVLNPKIIVLTALSNTLTEAQFLAGGTTIYSNYTSATPSTVNDNIVINLPDPTVALEGLFFFFRKMRGSINTINPNFTFNTPSARIVSLQTTANATGQPVATITQSGLFYRLVVCSFGGISYWTFI